jgi:hypothetical protein
MKIKINKNHQKVLIKIKILLFNNKIKFKAMKGKIIITLNNINLLIEIKLIFNY